MRAAGYAVIMLSSHNPPGRLTTERLGSGPCCELRHRGKFLCFLGINEPTNTVWRGQSWEVIANAIDKHDGFNLADPTSIQCLLAELDANARKQQDSV